MDTFNRFSSSFRKEDEYWHLKKLVQKFRNQLHWFLLSVFIALFIAFLLNHFLTPVYRISSKILIEEKDNNQQLTGALPGLGKDLIQGIGLYHGSQDLDNQSAILKSYALLYNTLREMKFEVSYFKKERFSSTELYKNSPFYVVFDSGHVQPVNVEFVLQILKNGRLKLTGKSKKALLYNYAVNKPVSDGISFFFSHEITPGEVLKSDLYSFSVVMNSQVLPESDLIYSFTFNNLNAMTLYYQENLSVAPVMKHSSLLELSIPMANPQKGMDFLNKLMEVYLKSNLEKKNEIASRTISSIEKQLSEISDSLQLTENRKQTFQSNRQVMDLSFQGEEIYKTVGETEKAKAELEAKQEYFIYLKNYLETHAELESIVAPSAMGIDDQLLNKLILELNRLSLEKSTLSASIKNRDHPLMLKLDAQIRNIKATLIENAKGLLHNSQIALGAINKRLSGYEQQVRSLPKTQRQYGNIERENTLNNEIYNYLLQRRAESKISRISNMPDNEIVDHANFLPDSPIFPKKRLNYILAFFIGLFAPWVILGVKNSLNNKIDLRNDISQITDQPIIGHVFHLDNEMPDTLLLNAPSSPAIEPFWAIHTQLDFLSGNKRCPVIVISSSCPGEGKTFCSINIATANALSGKKTLLMGFDLRNPRIHKAFNLDNTIGLSSCLIGATTPEEAIQKTMNENLDILPSGLIPPYPSQLVVNIRTRILINHLKKLYKCIIMDTAPMGLVPEAYFLARLADMTIIVVRQSYSNKEQLDICLKEVRNKEIHNISILMNDVPSRNSHYNFNYRYGYNYYNSGKYKSQ
ncbi:MAG: polysaccharide biosynthesis tyrosine autokinase [Bacteroidota bacterium]|nr:polysaccharide biosynthesis tyrosine autokinase [Bacteroidota bacterium]